MAYPLALLALQVEPSPLASSTLRVFLITALFMAIVIAAIVVTFRVLRKQRDGSGTAKLREDFEKSKERLLAAAMAKKQAAEKNAVDEREVSADEKERELLRENVDPRGMLGRDCAICGLELSEDEELVIDPYTGAGYHLSDFLSDWPVDDAGQPLPRPKFVYRYPQGTVVRSSDLIRTF